MIGSQLKFSLLCWKLLFTDLKYWQECIPVGCVPTAHWPYSLVVCLPWGGCGWLQVGGGGGWLQVGGWWPTPHLRSLPTVEQTDACENLTFARFAMRAVKAIKAIVTNSVNGITNLFLPLVVQGSADSRFHKKCASTLWERYSENHRSIVSIRWMKYQKRTGRWNKMWTLEKSC